MEQWLVAGELLATNLRQQGSEAAGGAVMMKSQTPPIVVRCTGAVNVDSVQVSLHPRGVRAKEGCSTEQSTFVLALKVSRD